MVKLVDNSHKEILLIEHNPAKKEDKEFIKATFDDSTIYRLSLK